MEQSRQFVIFGNFATINFENIVDLHELKEKYSFQIDAQPEAQNPSTGQMIIRPVFKSSDNKTIVFFGTSRIHVQQKDETVESYDAFNALSLELLTSIWSTFNLTVNRIAINGNVLIKDSKKMSEIFSIIFKENVFFKTQSDEWQFRINDKEYVDNLNCEVNKIISFNTVAASNPAKQNSMLVLSYDYNTRINNNNNFEIEQLNVFNNFAKKFRLKIVNR